MPLYSGDDRYLDPVSGVLKNRFGVANAKALEALEADLVAARSNQLANAPLPGNFDLAHLRAIHRYLFGDLYEWAGELRSLDISKVSDISKGSARFAHHAHITGAAMTLFTQLTAEKNLAGLDEKKFSERAAHYLAELNALHPFREGNGRTQREFISHLANANGYYVAWETMARLDLLEAMIESFSGNETKLAFHIRNALSLK